jgi:rifampicin phosphotransferase
METIKVQSTAGVYIRRLEELSQAALADAGGKGANLGELINAGLPVPPGFVVTASAYQALLDINGLGERIARRLRELAPHEPEAIAAASRDISGWVAAAPVPDSIRSDVIHAYTALSEQMPAPGAGEPGLPVAVRSSATAEDLPSASFAGQQETFLYIRGAAMVMEHVQKCWASLWTPQAISYRASMGFEHLDVALAVVVQAMVDAEVAGVMFTANPVSGARDEILISASYGLGEAVVSGAVTPDTFIVDADGAVRERTLGAKQSRVVPDVCGTRTEPVPPAERARYSLADRDLAGLARLARRVQAHYGAPQDTEWALSGGALYLLQARPITTLAKEPAPTVIEPDAAPINQKVSGLKQLVEYWPEPPTPLDVSFLREASTGMNALYELFGMRPAPELPQPVERDDGRMAVRISNPRLSPAILWQLPGRLLFTRGDPLDRWQVVKAEMEQAQARWQAAETANPDAPALARLVEQEMRDFGQLLGQRFGAVFFSGIKYFLLVKLWARLTGGKAGAAQREDRLMRAVPFRTALQNQAMARLAQVAAAHGKNSPEFQAALADFMAEWGTRPARGMASVPSTPSWREDPAQVLGLVDALLSDPDALTPEEALRRQEADYQAARAQVERGLWAPLRGLYRKSLARARSGVVAREDSLFRMEALTDAIRRTALHLGQLMARDGVLAEPEDVFFLLASELEPVAAGRLAVADLVRRRKQAYARVVAAHQRGQHWLVATGSVSEQAVRGKPARANAAPAGDGHTLRGQAASGGQVRGPVCVIHGPHEFSKMRKGAVLVAPFTAPVWTPLFRLASAVITEIGSPVSHAAIVAREYGIPAVVAAPNATSTLHDGQMVEVDGTRGVVTVLSSRE